MRSVISTMGEPPRGLSNNDEELIPRVPAEKAAHAFRLHRAVLPIHYRWLAAFTGVVMTIEGAIGVGKSTLGKSVEAVLKSQGIAAVYIPETFPEALLHQFIAFAVAHPDCKNPHAAPFQREMLHRRHASFRAAEKIAAVGGCAIVDRSLVGDYTFALMQFRDGHIDDEEWAAYEQLLAEVELYEPTMTLYLNCTPEKAKARCDARNRDNESGYTLDYFRTLMRTYLEVMQHVEYPCLFWQWNTNVAVDSTTHLLDESVVLSVLATVHQTMCPPPFVIMPRPPTAGPATVPLFFSQEVADTEEEVVDTEEEVYFG